MIIRQKGYRENREREWERERERDTERYIKDAEMQLLTFVSLLDNN